MRGLKQIIKKFIKHLVFIVRRFQHNAIGEKNYPQGINLLGNIRAENGLGQSCRLLAHMLLKTGEPVLFREFVANKEAFRNSDETFTSLLEEKAKYDINIIHMEPPELIRKYTLERLKDLDGRYNIAFWLWELETFPKSWKKAIDLVDEIWTPSEFSSNVIRKITSKPVYTVPYVVGAEVDTRYDRDYFAVPKDKFLYLIMYDSNSTMERKNPIGAIEAYKTAFPKEDEKAGLVIKINNPQPGDIDKIKSILEGYENVYFITEVLTKTEVNSLISIVDVFISLHRAEGFGLVMAEAMLNGTPCVATNWSSNTEFMDEESAAMVKVTFTDIKETVGAYEKGMTWAEPDVQEAAAYISQLFGNRPYYEKIRINGKIKIQSTLNTDSNIRFISGRLQEIREKKQG